MPINAGFPPLSIEHKKEIKDIKKERAFASKPTDLDIKHILKSSVIKPMINLNKNEVEVISSL
jgi:hypothetical protein